MNKPFTPDTHDTQPPKPWIQSHRILLVLAGSIYLAWWFVVRALLPQAFNPLGSRLVIWASFVIVLALSYRLPQVRRSLDILYAICASALTLHFFYLFKHNPGDVNWVVGSYITVVAVGMTLERLSVLIAYTLLVLAAAWYAVAQETVQVAIPGIITILALLQILAFLRRKADFEKQKRIKVEAERSSIESVSRAKSLFLANMSHELRTPLTSVIGYSDLMSYDEELSPDHRHSLKRIRASAHQLLDIVNQILNLTEDDFGTQTVKNEPQSIRDLLTHSIKDIEAEAQLRNIAISIGVIEPFADSILTDGVSLRRILHNILGNAMKFTLQGAIVVTLSMKVSDRPGFLILSIKVRDTGIGIEAADLQHVFDPFRQIQDGYTRPFGGVGLGLTVARKIARAMGGDVTILESIPKQGTTVQIVVQVLANGPTTFFRKIN